MKYKAVMIDVDGTLVDYDYEALPTQRVSEAIKKASELITVCVATGRSYPSFEKIVTHLELTEGVAIINNGAQVIDLTRKKVLYEKAIDPQTLKAITAILDTQSIEYFFNTTVSDPRKHKEYLPKGVIKVITREVFTEKEVDAVMEKISRLPSLTVVKSRHNDPNKFSLMVGHAEATKQHGILQVAEYLGIQTEEIVGIGDGYNDFPLLMACGLKVAMGNAVPDLKAIADYIAPPVTADGVAEVIEKFILK